MVITILVLIFLSLIKQSFLPISIFLTIYILINKFFAKNNSIIKFLSIFAVISVITISLLRALFGKGLLSQLFGTSKNPSIGKLWEAFLFQPIRFLGVPLFLSVVLSAILYNLTKISNESIKIGDATVKLNESCKSKRFYVTHYFKQKSYVKTFRLSLVLSLVVAMLRIIEYLGGPSLKKVYVLVAFLAILGWRFLISQIEQQKPSYNLKGRISQFKYPIAIGILISASLLLLVDPSEIKSLFSVGKVFFSQIIVLVLCIEVLIFVTRKLINWFNDRNSRQFFHIEVEEIILFISFVLMSVNSLSGGITIQSFPLYLPILFKRAIKSFFQDSILLDLNTKLALFTIVIGVVTTSSISQVILEPYVWWALKAQPVSLNSEKLDNFQPLSGFHVDAETKIIVNMARSEILKSNSKFDRILIGPNISGAKYLFPSMKVLDLRCRISWWDVCPDSELKKDRRLIMEKKPKFIFWLHNPDWVATAHESAFRKAIGYSELRQLDQWIQDLERGTDYRLVFSRQYFANNSDLPEDNARIVLLVRNE